MNQYDKNGPKEDDSIDKTDNHKVNGQIPVRKSERIRKRLIDLNPEDIGDNDNAKDKDYKGWSYYTRLEEEETLIGNGTVFFVNQLNFWGQTTLGLDCWN